MIVDVGKFSIKLKTIEVEMAIEVKKIQSNLPTASKLPNSEETFKLNSPVPIVPSGDV